MSPHVAAIYISPIATELPHSVAQAEARAQRGLVGDRYFEGCGTFSDYEPKGPGRELTLIENEVLTELGLSAAEARRNVVTQGIRLNELVGAKFRIGDVLIEGIRLCPPCTHLDKVTGKALLKPLADRGGLRANILSDGVIHVGDSIILADPTGTFDNTPAPPYYAVIFTSIRTDGDAGYGSMAERMVELAREQPGFLGVESARGADGLGITVSYWTTEGAIRNWKANAEHRMAQEIGKKRWYADYQVRVAKVERAYGKPNS